MQIQRHILKEIDLVIAQSSINILEKKKISTFDLHTSVLCIKNLISFISSAASLSFLFSLSNELNKFLHKSSFKVNEIIG